jgi:hypothetical protein
MEKSFVTVVIVVLNTVIVGPVRPIVGRDVNRPMECVLVLVPPPEDQRLHLPHDLLLSPPLSCLPPLQVDNPLELPL